jgi:hypothetical protein
MSRERNDGSRSIKEMFDELLKLSRRLDASLPRTWTPQIYKQKCSAVFEHVYES